MVVVSNGATQRDFECCGSADARRVLWCAVLQDTFCLTFSVEMDFFGDLRTIGLKPGGEDVPVTEENRHEYVELMVNYLLNR